MWGAAGGGSTYPGATLRCGAAAQRIERGDSERETRRWYTYTVAGGTFHQVKLARRAVSSSASSTSRVTGFAGP